MKKIALISTGGTIASLQQNEHTETLQKLNSEKLLSSVPEIADYAEIVPHDIFAVDSANLSFDDLRKLSSFIKQKYEEYDGFVITHGTDVMEETAFSLAITQDFQKPFVITGAMRLADAPSADGPANILSAIKVVTSEEAEGRGVMVAMNEHIISGYHVQKTHSFALSAFDKNAMGWVAENRVRFLSHPIHFLTNQNIGENNPVIPILECGYGMSPIELDILNIKKIDGLIIKTYGSGAVSFEISDSLAKMAEKIPVVFVTRTNSGEILKRYYNTKGTGGDLIDRGLISGGFLNSRQARMLLMIALSDSLKKENIKELFDCFN